MKNLTPILAYILLLACSNGQKTQVADNKYFELTENSNDILIRSSANEYELGDRFCYINQTGDTIIPYGRYLQSYTDTIITYGIVGKKVGDEYRLIGINNQGQKLYEVYFFDNGPDYISDGLFRIWRGGKIGFANADGKIVIAPQFECAFPFSDGTAKVTFDCTLEKEFEHTVQKSDTWFEIDKNGEKVE